MQNSLAPGDYASQCGQSLTTVLFFCFFFFFMTKFVILCPLCPLMSSEGSSGSIPNVCIQIYDERKQYNKSCWTDSHRISIYS